MHRIAEHGSYRSRARLRRANPGPATPSALRRWDPALRAALRAVLAHPTATRSRATRARTQQRGGAPDPAGAPRLTSSAGHRLRRWRRRRAARGRLPEAPAAPHRHGRLFTPVGLALVPASQRVTKSGHELLVDAQTRGAPVVDEAAAGGHRRRRQALPARSVASRVRARSCAGIGPGSRRSAQRHGEDHHDEHVARHQAEREPATNSRTKTQRSGIAAGVAMWRG